MNRLRRSFDRIASTPRLVVLTMLAVIGSYFAVVSLLVIVPSENGALVNTLFGAPAPIRSSNQNFATGNVQVLWFAGDCKINVSFVASSDPGRGTASGTITMAAVPGCAGEMTARVNCLIVEGNRALINGAIIQATGIFADGPGLMGILIENPPAANAEPTDQASFEMSGPRDCPPHSEPRPVPPVLEGGLTVHQAG
jgi:hypothetical protein